MQQPCSNCPFRKGSLFLQNRKNGGLPPQRYREIVHAIRNDGDFICHKTQDTKRTTCIGAIIFLEKSAADQGGMRMNVLFRLLLPSGKVKLDRLDLNSVDEKAVLTLCDES